MSHTSERKSMMLELDDLNKERRTGVIAHAAYDNIDRYGDISRKGMFDKSWSETKAENIRFDLDHDAAKQPGSVTQVFDNDKKAFTRLKFGTHTLGNDVMLMMDEGIIRGASFEFIAEKKATIEVKGRKLRELKEVRHIASTVTLALPPVNPEAGVVSVTKADIGAIAQFKSHIDRLEHFCRNTTASDETIVKILAEVKAAREIISNIDTAFTQQITEPDASDDRSEYRRKLLLLNMSMS